MKLKFLATFLFSFSILFSGYGQKLSSVQRTFLDKYGKEIRKDKKTGELICEPVAEAVSGKTIVALGELNHGSREIFNYRNDLIKYLHEKLGYDVVLFESGLGEMANVNYELGSLEGGHLTKGFFYGWRTSEFRELMEYLKKEKMQVGGFDVQRTGGGFVDYYKSLAESKGWAIKSCETEESSFAEVKGKLSDDDIGFEEAKTGVEELLSAYTTLLNSIDPVPGQEDPDPLLVRRTLENRMGYLKYMLKFKEEEDWNAKWKARDSLMAANVIWYRDNIFKGKKVILVAHNFHISKENRREEVMGEYLEKKYRNYYYSLGIFTGEGQYIDSRGNERTTEPPSTDGLDIKHIIEELDQPLTFIDCADKKYSGGDWLEEEIIINDSFIDLHGSNTLILPEVFDGILLIDRSSFPEK